MDEYRGGLGGVSGLGGEGERRGEGRMGGRAVDVGGGLAGDWEGEHQQRRYNPFHLQQERQQQPEYFEEGDEGSEEAEGEGGDESEEDVPLNQRRGSAQHSADGGEGGALGGRGAAGGVPAPRGGAGRGRGRGRGRGGGGGGVGGRGGGAVAPLKRKSSGPLPPLPHPSVRQQQGLQEHEDAYNGDGVHGDDSIAREDAYVGSRYGGGRYNEAAAAEREAVPGRLRLTEEAHSPFPLLPPPPTPPAATAAARSAAEGGRAEAGTGSGHTLQQQQRQEEGEQEGQDEKQGKGASDTGASVAVRFAAAMRAAAAGEGSLAEEAAAIAAALPAPRVWDQTSLDRISTVDREERIRRLESQCMDECVQLCRDLIVRQRLWHQVGQGGRGGKRLWHQVGQGGRGGKRLWHQVGETTPLAPGGRDNASGSRWERQRLWLQGGGWGEGWQLVWGGKRLWHEDIVDAGKPLPPVKLFPIVPPLDLLDPVSPPALPHLHFDSLLPLLPPAMQAAAGATAAAGGRGVKGKAEADVGAGSAGGRGGRGRGGRGRGRGGRGMKPAGWDAESSAAVCAGGESAEGGAVAAGLRLKQEAAGAEWEEDAPLRRQQQQGGMKRHLGQVGGAQGLQGSVPVVGRPKQMVRRLLVWRANEREALRKALLAFGLTRPSMVSDEDAGEEGSGGLRE
ncbi:unnamed protein product [Closterium sp. NIES-65]|nr:unnamed protein product [Closterium sp. NIES-65]